MESAAIASEAAAAETGDKGLKKDAIGFSDGLAIGLDSTAPAYSLADVSAFYIYKLFRLDGLKNSREDQGPAVLPQEGVRGDSGAHREREDGIMIVVGVDGSGCADCASPTRSSWRS